MGINGSWYSRPTGGTHPAADGDSGSGATHCRNLLGNLAGIARVFEDMAIFRNEYGHHRLGGHWRRDSHADHDRAHEAEGGALVAVRR